MSDFSSPRRPRRSFKTLLLVALLMGGAFFWANGNRSSKSTDEAFAAPRSSSPARPAPRPAHWVAATSAQRAAGAKTIRAQLHAFDTGNWKEAVKYQSAGLKGNFSSPELFGAMIQRNYPAFVGARRVDFDQSRASGTDLQMMVRLTGRDGKTTQALYDLVKEAGNYRIAGVSGGMVVPFDDQPQEENGLSRDGGLAV